MKRVLQVACFWAALAWASANQAHAQNLITNGGFDASGFNGWTRIDQTGSDGSWHQQTGAVSPVNGFAVPAPPAGSGAAMTDGQGPGSHVLYQDFVVPLTLSVAQLRFDLYINNHANAFFSPNTLDFATPALNQQFRVDILTASSGPFSVTVGDVLFNVYQTQPGNPLVSGYVTITADLATLLAAHAGETLRLRFAAADNVQVLNVGVDNVSLVVPEPASVRTLVGGLGLLAALLVRRNRRSR
jgi:hypothetical protein